MEMDVSKVRTQAEKELAREHYRNEVEKEKERLRQKRPLLHRLFPWKISFERRD